MALCEEIPDLLEIMKCKDCGHKCSKEDCEGNKCPECDSNMEKINEQVDKTLRECSQEFR